MNASRLDCDQSAMSTPAVSSMIDIGERRLALTSMGEGLPTVILETGLGAESHEWSTVQEAVGTFTRVVRYDRAGRGSSDPAARPRNASHMVEDLRALLRTADLPGPYVLVGHSFGGLLMRLFAYRYPLDVHSLILVDSMHEDQFDVLGPLFPPGTENEPPALRNVRRFWTGGWRRPESTTEGIDFVESIAQARAIDSLGDLPICVLTAGTFTKEPLVPPEHRQDLQRRWEQLQARFLKLSSRATQSFVLGSGHFIQRECPRAIVDEIVSAVKPARTQHEHGSL
jgi:pimeloyl-ACP methyl ester carboxylesterase